MSVDLPQRGPFTDQLVAFFTERMPAPQLVGDAVKPAGSGWPSTPQEGDFIGYVTIATAPAARDQAQSDSLASQGSAWNLTYTLLSVGAVRAQADNIADVSRAIALAFQGLSPLTLGPADWAIQSALATRMGSVDRNDITDPPYWQVSDSVTYRIVRNLKREGSV